MTSEGEGFLCWRFIDNMDQSWKYVKGVPFVQEGKRLDVGAAGRRLPVWTIIEYPPPPAENNQIHHWDVPLPSSQNIH